MARRRIGQEKLWGERTAQAGIASLDEVAGLVDWAELDALLAGISAAAEGQCTGRSNFRPWGGVKAGHCSRR